jgi:hypothetical protein
MKSFVVVILGLLSIQEFGQNKKNKKWTVQKQKGLSKVGKN